MPQGWRTRSWGRQRDGIEGVLQDRLHALIATGLGEEGSSGSSFHAFRRVLLGRANDAETGTIAHLGVRLLAQDAFEAW